jgi:endogenous inhibitor of DNA gyrase (YacG/DUF329 family)
MKHRCPICRNPTDSEKDADFPFCSDRCRQKDLGNWATEKYVVSEPIFNEDDLVDKDEKTIILDLNTPNESEHDH